ncbi:MAG: hypothetical protein AAGD25_06330 [Cyanobacteria bacterium P01_F01_bin.150]
MQAYLVEWGGVLIIACDESRNKLKAQTAESLMDTGYAQSFIEALQQFRLKRCSEMDYWTSQQKPCSREVQDLINEGWIMGVRR